MKHNLFLYFLAPTVAPPTVTRATSPPQTATPPPLNNRKLIRDCRRREHPLVKTRVQKFVGWTAVRDSNEIK